MRVPPQMKYRLLPCFFSRAICHGYSPASAAVPPTTDTPASCPRTSAGTTRRAQAISASASPVPRWAATNGTIGPPPRMHTERLSN